MTGASTLTVRNSAAANIARRWAAATLCLIGVATLALLAAGCSSTDEDSVEPLDEVLSGPIEIVELTSNGAAVQVTTDVDMVCSVVYGLDDSYGSQTTDPGMGELAHRQHFAPMRGLQPDTEYHYRVQGTATDGTIYASEDLTFRTLPEDDQAAGDNRLNVASANAGARVVDISSEFSATWSGANAIDDDAETEWSSAGDGDGAFITIELAEVYELSGIGLWTRTMGASAQISSFQVVTEDGTVLGPFDVPDATQMHVFPVTVAAQELRFEVLASSGGNTGAVELAAFTGD